MFDERDDARADAALRGGLADLPVPVISPGFDSRVLGTLRRPTPWRTTICPTLRPVLSAAACSLLVMLTVLHWASIVPLESRAPHSSLSANVASSSDSEAARKEIVRDADVPNALDSPYLSAASLLPLNAPRLEALVTPAAPAAEPERSAPGRRSETATRP